MAARRNDHVTRCAVCGQGLDTLYPHMRVLRASDGARALWGLVHEPCFQRLTNTVDSVDALVETTDALLRKYEAQVKPVSSVVKTAGKRG